MEQGTLIGTILAWFMLLFAMTFNFATLSINAGNVQYFWDTPSLMIVFGGTIASTFISHPMGDAKGFLGIIGKSWKPNSVQLVETLTLIVDVSKIARKKYYWQLKTHCPASKTSSFAED
jgi:Flagellar motor component